jgi:hypothetical protein
VSRAGRGERRRPENADGDDAGRRDGRKRGSGETRPEMQATSRLSDAAQHRSGSAPTPEGDVAGLELGIERCAFSGERLAGCRWL